MALFDLRRASPDYLERLAPSTAGPPRPIQWLMLQLCCGPNQQLLSGGRFTPEPGPYNPTAYMGLGYHTGHAQCVRYRAQNTVAVRELSHFAASCHPVQTVAADVLSFNQIQHELQARQASVSKSEAREQAAIIQ